MRIIVDSQGVKLFDQGDLDRYLRSFNVRCLIDKDGDEVASFVGLQDGANYELKPAKNRGPGSPADDRDVILTHTVPVTASSAATDTEEKLSSQSVLSRDLAQGPLVQDYEDKMMSKLSDLGPLVQDYVFKMMSKVSDLEGGLGLKVRCEARDALFALPKLDDASSNALAFRAKRWLQGETTDMKEDSVDSIGARLVGLAWMNTQRNLGAHWNEKENHLAAALELLNHPANFVQDACRLMLSNLLVRDASSTAALLCMPVPGGWAVPFKAISAALDIHAQLPADSDSHKRLAFVAQARSFIQRAEAGLTQWRDSLVGSVMGQCLGDALGFLVEGQSGPVCQKYVREILVRQDVRAFGVHKEYGQKGNSRYVPRTQADCVCAFGQYTDDSQLMRELLRSLVATGGDLDPGEFGRRIALVFAKSGLLKLTAHQKLWVSKASEPGIVGYGTATRRAAQRLMDGDDWRETGDPVTQGNGGCMRAGPLGVLLLGRKNVLVDMARNQSRPTHPSSRCTATAVLVAGAARLAAVYRGNKMDPHAFCAELSTLYVRGADVGVADAVLTLPSLLAVDGPTALAAVVKTGEGLGDDLWAGGAVISASTVQASLWALLCFLRTPDDTIATLHAAISAGGDADTTAAMAGAIAGARNGTEKLPAELLDCLHDQGTWRRADLENLCAKAAEVAETRGLGLL